MVSRGIEKMLEAKVVLVSQDTKAVRVDARDSEGKNIKKWHKPMKVFHVMR